jgi:hypothetical protein
VIVVAGVRVVVTRAGLEEPWLIAAVAVPLGVAVPLAAASFAEGRPWAAWVFDLPGPLKRSTQVVVTPAAAPGAVTPNVTSPGADTAAPQHRSTAAHLHRMNTARTSDSNAH